LEICALLGLVDDIKPKDDFTYTNTAPSKGTATVSEDGTTYCFIPNAGFCGIDEFYVLVCDTALPVQCDFLRVIVTVGDFVAECNDTIYTCTVEFPTEITLCIPECLWADGYEITDATSTFNCAISYMNDSCITYQPLPGMPLGYADQVTINY